ncbi:TetR family transcriptional regulator C-terminal domain-containing protein [Enterobacter sp. Bisph1]|uniref:acrylate utilization transcriptional regulator AcuR n=1 Tax=Enterobacter sp. Bisph1 TaxID=1274399 RepID=UPI00057C04B0|nr:TetR family transcriptional regulator C-terminal domain-containing protein [Enterobacter sp. Bisph1]
MSGETVSRLKPRRGRPPKDERDFTDTRQALIRSGLEVLTETGYLSAGIDRVIKNIAVPKGSFYHCFKSKQEFGMAVLDAYGDFFAHKLDKFLSNRQLAPLERIDAFVHHAGQGMAKYAFRRGCLVGNLLQEAPLLPQEFPARLKEILADWETRIAHCLDEAIACGELPPASVSHELAKVFWSGWEGAVMRARLFCSTEPLDTYWAFFRHSITISPAA